MDARRIGRYAIGPEIAAGGMAAVHLGRMYGPKGFGKTVALKRLHAQYARDPEFVKMFHDEVRVTSGLTHANIVMTLDVLEDDDELYLVMEYVHGASLAQIQRQQPDRRIPVPILAGIMAGVLEGLHAAHEATDEQGDPLGIIHRDVSPQNVLVSFQGVPKIADFGIAKAAGRAVMTADGSAKGKVWYMSPEQVRGDPVTRLADVYAAAVVLWECLAARRLIDGKSAADSLRTVLTIEVPPPSTIDPAIPRELDDVVMRALARKPEDRFQSAQEMGAALRRAVEVAHASEIAAWLRSKCGRLIEQRERVLGELKRALGTALISTPELSTQEAGTPDPTAGATPGRDEDGVVRGLPPRRPPWLLPSVGGIAALGVAGVVLVLVSASRPGAPSQASSSLVATGAAASALEPSPPIPEPEPSAWAAVAPSDSADVVAVEGAPAGSGAAVAAPPAPAARPRAKGGPAPAPKRKCRIVTSVDGAGHTKFTEVCQ